MGNSTSAAHADRAMSDSGDEYTLPMPRYYDTHEFHCRPRAPRYKLADKKVIRRKFMSEDFSLPSSPTTIPTLFRWSKGGQSVHLMGSFDGWTNRIPLVISEDEFIAIVELPVGRHEYKFLVDGEWSYDPDEPRVDNGLQSFNNVVTIKETDFEVFKALAADDKSLLTAEDRALDNNGFGQEVPSNMAPHQRPPTLPPQLLQIVLNKETPHSVDPTILHAPHLAELNHLHALSIKGGVITMSSTHRYKKKYITTIFYQPT